MNSNSKDTFQFWLREMKNQMNIHPYSLESLTKCWLSLFHNKMEREHLTLQEAFNSVYGLTKEKDNKIRVRSKLTREYELYKYN